MKIQKKKIGVGGGLAGGGGWEGPIRSGVGGCKPRIKGIDKCK